MESNEEKKNRLRNAQHTTMLALPACNIDKETVNNPSGLEGNLTLENSIFMTMRNIDNDRDKMFLCCFLECSINIFNVHKWAFEANITNSSSPTRLVEAELKKLNHFFETGGYQAGKAHHSRLATEEVYDVHASRLYGERVRLINPEKWGDLAEVLDSDLIKYPSNQASIEHWNELTGVMGTDHIAEALGYFKENIDHVVTLEWYLSIDLQVLLWLRDYLEELNKSKNFNEIFSNHERVSPLEFLPSESTRQGFTIANPTKTIPALHDALIEGGLINNINQKDFEDAFLNGEGFIRWSDSGTCLAYLLDELDTHKIILSINIWKTSENVFEFGGKHGSLKGSVAKVAKKKKGMINGIIVALKLFL